MVNRFYLRYRTKKTNGKNLPARHSINYRDAREIGILFTTDDIQKHNAIKTFIENLENDHKNVQTLTFLPKGKDNIEFKFDFFTKKEFGYWGTLENQKAKDFISKPFDFLFFLDDNLNPFNSYVLANSNSKCRVGRLGNGFDEYFELMIKPKSRKFSDLIDDLLVYIKKI